MTAPSTLKPPKGGRKRSKSGPRRKKTQQGSTGVVYVSTRPEQIQIQGRHSGGVIRRRNGRTTVIVEPY